MSIEVTVTNKISEERVKDLLCCAFEGGSNYWYFIDEYEFPEDMKELEGRSPHLDVPLMEDGNVIITELEDRSVKNDLNLKTIKRGLEIMAEKYPIHYGNFIRENEDAETGDVFLQCCLYGKLIFG